MKTVFRILLLITIPVAAFAEYEPITWDQTFRESGKIYVVVAVALLILLSLVGYMVSQDLRMRKIEKELKQK